MDKCETCKFDGDRNKCADCDEGSEYEYASLDEILYEILTLEAKNEITFY